METIATTTGMKDWSRARRAEGKSIGLVPTMGFLHEGHLSLIRRCRSENDLVVVSIFVNPTQFGPGEDFERYPRDPESDSGMCRDVGTDVIYMPEPSEMYRPGHQTFVEVGEITEPLCGASRPTHFRGVATVVVKLFNIALPTRAYFGTKDYQQLQVIERAVRDLDMDVRIVPCPIVRESDGIAMSSRNAYLKGDLRKQALCLVRALRTARSLFRKGERDAKRYIEAMSERIEQEPDAVIDYVSLVDPETLRDLVQVEDRALAALAVNIGPTRLIDNMLFDGDEDNRG
jgi:pantoate--beta-alanine ligase